MEGDTELHTNWEKSHPAYSRDMKELAMEFNEFFTEVGVRTAEEAKRLASVNDLTTSHQEFPVSFIPEEAEFRFRAATSFEVNRIVQSFPSNKAPGKDKYIIIHGSGERCSTGYPPDFDQDHIKAVHF